MAKAPLSGPQFRIESLSPACPKPEDDWNIAAFSIKLGNVLVGFISLRRTVPADILPFFGHVGYEVLAQWRGRGIAKTACLLLREKAKEFGFTELLIACEDTNIASQKTCENIGASFVGSVQIKGQVRFRYLWKL